MPRPPVPKVPAEVVHVKTAQRFSHLCENGGWSVLSSVFQHVPMRAKGHPALTFQPASGGEEVFHAQWLHVNPAPNFFMTGFCASGVSGTP